VEVHGRELDQDLDSYCLTVKEFIVLQKAGSPMRIRAVFLDFGGTLVHPVPDIYAAFAPVFERLGLDITPEQYAKADARVWPTVAGLQYSSLGKTPSFWDLVHTEVLKELGISDRQGEIVEALREAATSPALHAPFPDTEEALRRLRERGIPLHVVSNNTDYLIEIISRLGWTDRFDAVTFSQQAGAEKPNRRVFDLAVARAKCQPEEVLHVGDSFESDYLGATRAGLKGAWLNRNRLTSLGSCLTISHLGEVADLISREGWF
jgi:putative hydrolase of the HAD superfamily